jgi:hypothetical protein
VPQLSNAGFDNAQGGGMTVYYMQDPLYDTAQKSKVTAFKPVRCGFFSSFIRIPHIHHQNYLRLLELKS